MMVVEDTEEQMGRVFSTNGTPLMAVPLFRYLRQTLSFSDNNWTAIEQNLQRAEGKWGWLEMILGKGGRR